MNLNMFQRCLYEFQYINWSISRQMAPPECNPSSFIMAVIFMSSSEKSLSFPFFEESSKHHALTFYVMLVTTYSRNHSCFCLCNMFIFVPYIRTRVLLRTSIYLLGSPCLSMCSIKGCTSCPIVTKRSREYDIISCQTLEFSTLHNQ
jgi:hypothetical protein